MSDRHVLAIFAKEPKPGQVKSRLAAGTSPEWAAQVAEAFLLDWLARLKDFPACRVLVFTPTPAKKYFAARAGTEFELEPQSDGDLGRRMVSFLSARLARGAERIVIIGTDSPTMPVEYLHRAFEELAHREVVLGPAKDGGYYLIGCRRRVPDVFTGIDWGRPTVLAETLGRLRQSNTAFSLLPSWYDVDTSVDWQELCTAVKQQVGSLPHIEKLIQTQPS